LILPGSRSTLADLIWLRRQGWDRYLADCLQRGTEVLGICGGFQMLGQMLYDPSGVESSVRTLPGLGLLPVSTLFLKSKVTAQVRGVDLASGAVVRGYEIHHGQPQGLRRGQPVFRILERSGVAVNDWDGCRMDDRPVWGTYLHGLFEEEPFRRHFLHRVRARAGLPQPPLATPAPASHASPLDPYDRLAEQVKQHVQVDKILDCLEWMPSACA
jgi:adenosylcobyric acid synthase